MKKTINGIEINYVPSYAMEYPYICYRECDGENYFWGAFETESLAFDASIDMSGEYIYNPEWKA